MTQLASELIVSGSILFITIFIAVLAAKLLARASRRFHKNGNELMCGFTRDLKVPAGGLVLIAGIHTALLKLTSCSFSVSLNDKWFVAAATLLVVYAISKGVSLAIRWYIGSQGDPTLSSHTSVYSKIVVSAIWVFASVLILDQLGYKITTIIAGLGVAGLAVGLGLQDTIANLFSGFYLMMDRSVRSGDYIKLDSGVEGFVDVVGWRNTRIKVWSNNLVLVPNSKLIQSVITNCTLPSPSVLVSVPCRISYGSDLEKVERVAVEAAKEVMARVPGADTGFEPLVRFKEFGESCINFAVTMRSVDVDSQYLLQHEFMKALHKRFIGEGIEIFLPHYSCQPLNRGDAE
ncbi:MAG: mechanosensitive ion channel family protein [Armatimonadota bacterium]